jgi:hypothetical protein
MPKNQSCKRSNSTYTHLYRDVDKVADFSDLKNLSTLEEEEYPNLKRVVHIKEIQLRTSYRD